VGSLSGDIHPGGIALPTEYLDLTKYRRSSNFVMPFNPDLHFSIQDHKPMVDLVDKELLKRLKNAARMIDVKTYDSTRDLTYVCVEGPRFSSRMESRLYRGYADDWGVIGMTGCPEVFLAKELKIPFVHACLVTDVDSWNAAQPHVTVDEVLKVMKKNVEKVTQSIQMLLTVWDNTL